MSDPFAYFSGADDTIRRPLPSPAAAPSGTARVGVPSYNGNGRGPLADLAGIGLDEDFFGARQPSARRGFEAEFGGGERKPLDATVRHRGDTTIDKAFELAAVNKLVSAASPLLWLAGRLNESAPPDDIAEFRDRTVEEIRRFETSAMAKDVPNRTVRVARYALCAVIDDIILNTSWGGLSGWASMSLVGTLYNETWGGERFYDLLSQLLMQPDDNIEALELMAICLAIGFSGKYRVMEGGQGQLTRLRHDLYRTIRRVRGPYERKLSTAWQSIDAPNRAPRSMSGPWLAAALVVVLLAALWGFSSITLRSQVELAAEQIRALAPSIPVVVERAGVPDIPEPTPPVRQTQMERLSAFLADEIAADRIELAEVSDTVVVRMLGASFPSGGVNLSAAEEPLIARIGQALNAERGPITVIGHTDNVPVGAGSPLGDNTTISVARARSAAEMLQRHIDEPSRVSFEGRGENDPIAANATEEGRARNRRVEFRIPAEATL